MDANPDLAVVALGERQHGLVTTEQCMGCGLSETQLRCRVRRGSLIRVHRGVLRLAGSVVTFEQRALAACLAAGPDAYASHRTAGVFWGAVEHQGPLEVTVPAARLPRVQGLVIHRSALLRPHERSRKGLVPLTSPARTLLDLAKGVDRLTLARAVDAVFRSGVLEPSRLSAYLEDPAFASFAGIRTLREIAWDRGERGVSESELETLAIELIALVGLPEPVRQFEVVTSTGHARIDLAYPERLLGIELDGRASRAGYDPFRLDRERQNELEQQGWTFRRFTWEHLTQRPAYFVGVVGDALGMLPTRWCTRRLPRSTATK